MQVPHPDQEFHAHLAAGRFMLQRSRSSGRHVFPPRVAEPGTGARDLEWVEASGLGRLYSFTEVAQKTPRENYNIALVDLEEGPRVLSTLQGAPAEGLPIGAPVRAQIVTREGQPLLVFVPAQAASGGAA
ncbi:MAG: OB-fold domain-containing protein [Burkholderiaceae bacterium]|nr:OB-fold domain-containing protein [Burkholderiaceae bacterium]